MKKILNFNVLIVICFAAIAMSFAGCSTKNLEASLQKEAPANVRTVSLSFADSISVNGVGSGVRIKADFPTYGSPLVVNSIREWISETLGGTYTGSLADGQDMLQYYVKTTNKDLQKDLKEFDAPENVREGMAWYDYNRFAKTYETDLLVTYTHTYETYCGGAHGMHGASGQTFRKIDGRRMDWNVFQSDRMDDLRNLVKKAVQEQYFEAADEAALNEMIFEEKQMYFPLPETSPCFLEEGVEFTYQVYEIAPYAAGQPSCIIPYELLAPYFSATGKSLIPNTSIAKN